MKKIILMLVMLMLLTSTAFALEPIDVQERNIDAKSREIIMTYIISNDSEKERTIASSFVKDGYLYNQTDYNETDVTEISAQEVSVQKTHIAGQRFSAQEFSETIEYEQDGFTGI